MRRTSLILLVLLVPWASAASVSFAPPGQYSGDLETRGVTWALLFFHDSKNEFSMRLEDAQHTNHSLLRGELTTNIFGNSDKIVTPGSPEAQEGEAWASLSGSVAFHRGWASLYVEATHINLTALGSQGSIHAADGGRPEDYTPSEEPPPRFTSRRYGREVPSGGVAFSVLGTEAAVPVSLSASGVTRLEWSNASIDCNQASCPDGARMVQSRADVPGGSHTVVKQIHFAEVQSRSGSLAGGGLVVAAAVGGPAMDASVRGSIRLPGAHLADCSCPSPNGTTLSSAGTITFSAMTSEDSRVVAGLGGDLQAVRFDETEVDPALFDSKSLAATAGITVVGLVVVKVLGWLFTRITGEATFGHPIRRRIHAYIKRHPGCIRRHALQALGLAEGTFAHHLGILVSQEQVALGSFRGRTHLFTREDYPNGRLQQWLLLRDFGHVWIMDAVRNQPGLSQADLMHMAQDRGLSRSAAQRRVAGLMQHGLVTSRRDGRHVRYRLAPTT